MDGASIAQAARDAGDGKVVSGELSSRDEDTEAQESWSTPSPLSRTITSFGGKDTAVVYNASSLNWSKTWGGTAWLEKVHEHRWYVSFSKSAYTAMKNGAISTISHSSNAITGTSYNDRVYQIYAGSGYNSQVGSGAQTATSQVIPISSMVNENNAYSFQVFFQARSYDGAFSSGTNINLTIANTNSRSLWISVSYSDNTAPVSTSAAGERTLKINDAVAGIRYVEITGPGLSSARTFSSADSMTGFTTSDTRNFEFKDFPSTGDYTIYVEDNVGNTRTFTHNVPAYEFGKEAGNTGLWGSAANPYLIENTQHLVNLAAIVNGNINPTASVDANGTTAAAKNTLYQDSYFKVVNNITINFSDQAVIAQTDGRPIGKDTSHPFKGHFNGNGKTITITMNTSANYAGLFGYMQGGSVTSLTVAGTVTGTGSYTGGIVGHAHTYTTNGTRYGTTFRDVTNNTTVNGKQYTGGIVGCGQDSVYYGAITNNGTVTGTNGVGGITGFNFGGNTNSATIINKGAISGTNYVAGIAGEFNWGTVGGNLTNEGRITASGNYAGGIIGYLHDNGNLSGTYINKGVVTGPNYVGGIMGGNVYTTTNNYTFSGNLTFRNSSYIHGTNYVGGLFGYLDTLGKTINGQFNVDTTSLPSGASGESVAHSGAYAGGFFGWLASGGTINFANGSAMNGEIDLCESTIKLHGDKTGNVVGGVVGVNMGTHLNFASVTNVITSHTINANREGAGTYTIDGVSYTGAIIGGIAGFNKGNITGREGVNLRAGGNLYAVACSAYLGGVVGINRGGTLTNCKVNDNSAFANSSFIGRYVGGIVGYMDGGAISSGCSFTGQIRGSEYVGSIAGYLGGSASATVLSYTNNNKFTLSTAGGGSGDYIGGLFGYINTTGGVYITTATNNVALNGRNYVGGIVGRAENGLTCAGTLTNGGSITGTGNYIGGLFGEAKYITMSGNYVNGTGKQKGDVIGRDYVGGIAGSVILLSDVPTGATFKQTTYVYGVNYVGGLFGELNTNGCTVNAKFNLDKTNLYECGQSTHADNCYRHESVAGVGVRIGGFFGSVVGSGTIKFAQGSQMSGEIDGYESKVMPYGVGTGSVVGGIAGQNSATLDFSACTAVVVNGNNIGSRSNSSYKTTTLNFNGADHTGAFIGGIAGFNSGTIIGSSTGKALHAGSNIFSVSHGNFIGGIAAVNTGTIKNCTISGGGISASYTTNYVGGITGYNTGSIQNCSVAGNTPGYSYVGGIAGYNSGSIQYVVNQGAVSGTGDYVGGIVGQSNTASTLIYAYNFGTVTAGSGKTNLGGIVGGYNGTPGSGTTVDGAWSFHSSVPSGQTTGESSYFGYFFINNTTKSDGTTVAIHPSTGSTNYTDWLEISIPNRNYTSFYVTGVSVDSGDYLSLEYLNKDGGITGFASPLNITNPYEDIVVNGKVSIHTVKYGASYINTSSNVRIRYFEIGVDKGDNVYDGSHKAENVTFFGETKTGPYYTFDKLLDSADDVNAGTYYIDVTVSYNGVIMGAWDNSPQQVLQFDLGGTDPNDANGAAIFLFDGTVYGNLPTYKDSSLGVLTNITSFKDSDGIIKYNSSGNEKIYIYRQKGSTMTLLYVVNLNYGQSGMLGTNYPTNSNPALKGAISTSHGSLNVSGGFLVQNRQDGTTTFTPSVNYKTEIIFNYLVIDSDFGKVDSITDRNGDGKVERDWGSVDNPYVISHWVHLLRLSEIVNKVSQPIDSVSVTGARSTNTNYTAYTATDGTVKQCYFVVSANIDISGANVTFLPIGGWQMSKSSMNGFQTVTYSTNTDRYFGGVFDGQFTAGSGTMRTITLGNKLNHSGHSYVGLFGLVHGEILNGSKYFAEIKNINVSASNINGGNFVGAVVGKADVYTILDEARATVTGTIDAVDFVGGIAGFIGRDVEMYGEYVNTAKVRGRDFVGGIIGQVMAGAGRQGSGTNQVSYYLGQNAPGLTKQLKLENRNDIIGDASYVGGIIGGMMQNTNSAYSAVMTIFEPTYMRNLGNVSGYSYIGGLIGSVGENNAVHVRNSGDDNAMWSYNGKFDEVVDRYVAGSDDNVGGLFGYLSFMGHVVTSLFNTADVYSVNGNNVGGLVGEMQNGTLTNCFVTKPGTGINSNIEIADSLVYSSGNSNAENIGGIVGYLVGGTLDTCYSQGFNFASVNATKGGVAGVATTSSVISNTWTLYVTNNPTYKTVPANNYGKFIVAYEGAMAPTVYELFVFAGLYEDSNLDNISDRNRATGTVANEIVAQKGHLTLGVTLPNAGTIRDFDTPAQVVFYDGSGYENAYEDAFIQAANDSTGGNLFLRLDGVKRSLIVAKTGVRFGSVSNYDSDTAWESVYTNIGAVNLYKVDVYGLQNNTNSYIGKFKTSFSYDLTHTQSNTSNRHYVQTSREVSFVFDRYSEVAPRIISNLDDWKAFALDVQQSGEGGLKQYVKLATNLTIPTKYEYNGKIYSGLAGLEDTPFWNNSQQNVTRGYFSGTFDGDGHTITINIQGGENGYYAREIVNGTTTQYHGYFTDQAFVQNSGYITSGNANVGNTNETLAKLFDNNTATKLCYGGSTSITFTYALPDSAMVTGYQWNVANDTGKREYNVWEVEYEYPNSNRNPGYFKIEGSNSSSGGWTTLIEESSNDWTIENYALVDRSDSFTRKGVYRYFRITIRSKGDMLQLSEFKIISPDRVASAGNVASSYNELGLFPQASGATFKHLNLAGTISNAGYDVAAFVGHARGSLSFYNCTSTVSISSPSGYSAGAFIGTTKGNRASASEYYEYELISCVNQGNIITLGQRTQFGTGGLIGNVWNGNPDTGYDNKFNTAPKVTIDSCRNTGDIVGTHNVAGMIGRNGGTTTVISCGNTGKIEAICKGNYYGDRVNKNSLDYDANAGGMIGLITQSGTTDVYASYNSGEIRAWGSTAGGILGSDNESSGTSHTTKIYYCYNTGKVITGADVYTIFWWAVTTIDATFTNKGDYYEIRVPTTHGWGTHVGGIIGISNKCEIKYCYNTGDISMRGVAGASGYWEARIGGIVGYVAQQSGTSINNCYNVGDIRVQSMGATGSRTRTRFPVGVGGIVGTDSNNENISYVKDCYSLAWQVHWKDPEGYTTRLHCRGDDFGMAWGWDEGLGYYTYNYRGDYKATTGSNTSSGTVVYSVSELTAIINGSQTANLESVVEINRSPGGSYSESTSSSKIATESSVRSLNVTNIKAGSYPGWLYVYGCLPQLAVFAVDTYNGLAMTSVGYGKNSLGVYNDEPLEAGSEVFPYVIKDGIDLLGMSALVSANSGGYYFDFSGKYVEFADGTNNLSKTVTNTINMPTGDVNDGTFYTYNSGGKGKSYHLFDRGANGLHYTDFFKKNALKKADQQPSGTFKIDSTSEDSLCNAPASSMRASGQSYTATLDMVTTSASMNMNGTPYATWLAKNYGNTGSGTNYGWGKNKGYTSNDFIPIGVLGYESGSTSLRSFKGSISGKKTDGSNTVISGINVDLVSGNTVYGGLFGYVDGAYIENITVTGSVRASSTNSSKIVAAGIIGKARNNTTIKNVNAGSSSTVALTVSTGSGNAGYTGGIVGWADAGASGNRLVVENCKVINATITGFKDSIGGIIGYVYGSSGTSFVDVLNCHVTKADIKSSSSSDVGRLGGIVGAQGDRGALAVSNCTVGTNGASGENVKITGAYAIGGIISRAEASAQSSSAFLDCSVYGDVLIKRQGTTNGANNIGTAIGGIAGYVSDSSTGRVTFSGTIQFHGKIDANVANTSNVGGAIGYMGQSANLEESFVQIYGTVNANASGVHSVGGFAGRSMGACLSGDFLISPTMNTQNANNVGGFIGYNDGDTFIARTAQIYTGVRWTDSNKDGKLQSDEIADVESSIYGNTSVGGFIGFNNTGCALHMGASEYKGTYFGDDDDSCNISLNSNVDGKYYVGGFLGYNDGIVHGLDSNVTNYGNVGTTLHSTGGSEANSSDGFGGVFGNNAENGQINIGEGSYFINRGQVGRSEYTNSFQDFVGGIIGMAFGTLHNEGSFYNIGEVYGYEYVGGAIGGVVQGTISGTLSNGTSQGRSAEASSEALIASAEATATADEAVDAQVTAVRNVGGIVGVVMQGATVKDAVMTNYGSVTSTGDENNVSNLGGIIGLMYGKLGEATSKEYSVVLYNYGVVTAANFAGGIIGVSDGSITQCELINYATISFSGNSAMGGTIGYITSEYVYNGYDYLYPQNTEKVKGTSLPAYIRNGTTGYVPSTVTNTYFGYETLSTEAGAKVMVQATGQKAYPYTDKFANNASADSAFKVYGGLGGVIGAITSTDITSYNQWSGNSFFIFGDVYGGTFVSGTNFSASNFTGKVDGVGGVIGAIEGAYVTINNMLVYESNVGGNRNVGGIIGYNASTNSNVGSNAFNDPQNAASIDNCYNVYGSVIGTGNVGGIVGFVKENGENTPLTNSSYWVKEFDNNHLQSVNPNDVSGSLDRASSWTEFISAREYENDILCDDEGNEIENTYFNDTITTWDDYFAASSITYVQNQYGDWGTYSGNNVKYTTGDKKTGYYFIYASNSSTAGYTSAPQGNAINVVHSNASSPFLSPYGATSYENLNFWLIIADAVNQNYKEYASDIVSSKQNGGKVQVGYLHATAYTATKSGYYLYVSDGSNVADGNTSPTTIYRDSATSQKLYIASNTRSAGNVIIYYKKAVLDDNVTYNGYDRYAPIAELTYKQDTTEANTPGVTYFTFDGMDKASGLNMGREAGEYDTKAKIYTIESGDGGSLIELGKIDSTDTNDLTAADYKWKIYKRVLKVNFSSGDIPLRNSEGDPVENDVAANRYDGTFSHYISFTATNFVADSTEFAMTNQTDLGKFLSSIQDMIDVTYSFDGDEAVSTKENVTLHSSGIFDIINVPEYDGDADYLGYYYPSSDGASNKAGDVGYTIYNNGRDTVYGNLTNVTVCKTSYIFYVKKAGVHTITVNTAEDENNHIHPYENSHSFSVDKKQLFLNMTYSGNATTVNASGYAFDGGVDWQGIQAVNITGFYVGDAIANNIVTNKSYEILAGSGTQTHSLIDDKKNGTETSHIESNADNSELTVYFFANDAGEYHARISIAQSVLRNYKFAEGANYDNNADVMTQIPNNAIVNTWEAHWKIKQHTIQVEGSLDLEDRTVYYNGQAQSVAFKTGGTSTNLTPVHGNETISIECEAIVTDENGNKTSAVNVGKYDVQLAAGSSGSGTGAVTGENSKAIAGIKNYVIKYTVTSSSKAELTVVARPIEMRWKKNMEPEFIYTGQEVGYDESVLEFWMDMDEDPLDKVTDWKQVKDVKITLDTDNGKVKVAGVFKRTGKSETLIFNYSGFKNITVGDYTAKVANLSAVQGSNDDTAGVTTKNYEDNQKEDGGISQKYSIIKAIIEVFYNNDGNFDRTFNSYSKIDWDKVQNQGTFTIVAQGGKAPTSGLTVVVKEAYFCDEKGNKMSSVNTEGYYHVEFVIEVIGNDNLELENTHIRANTQSSITPAPIVITLNSSTSGVGYTVYKTFDGNDVYAYADSNVTEVVSSNSAQFRAGRGITVSGFFTSGVRVVASFAEMDEGRDWAGAYVNNVVRGDVDPETGIYTYSMAGEEELFLKMLVITLEETPNTAYKGQISNYYIAEVRDRPGATLKEQDEGTSITVVDSRSIDLEDESFTIGINPYSLKASYFETSQSYVGENNTYNEVWKAVYGEVPTKWQDLVRVEVTNGWMYKNGIDDPNDDPQIYDRYTYIAGNENSTLLGARLASDLGYNLCIDLKNQPTVVIGYFVDDDGEAERIDTMAGLLIATEYYRNNFNAFGAMGYDFVETVLELPKAGSDSLPAGKTYTTWAALLKDLPDYNPAGYSIGGVSYPAHPKYKETQDKINLLNTKIANADSESEKEKLQAERDAYQSQLDSFEIDFVKLTGQQAETLQYVYWAAKPVSENHSYKNFVLANNIDAILTESDMKMLKGAFGTNWGVGKTYLPNVVFAEVGSVVIFNRSVFDYVDGNPFDGTFDGQGYVINHLTITYSAESGKGITKDGKEYHSVGMFADVQGVNSVVTGINLRNLSIQVVDNSEVALVINVGGIAGKFAGSEAMKDVSVHGNITVMSKNGTVYVGGIIGSDSTGYSGGASGSVVIERGLVVATLRAEGAVAVAGGIVGIMNAVNNSLVDVVSMSEVYAEGTTETDANGFVGKFVKYDNGTSIPDSDGKDFVPTNSEGKESAFMASVFEIIDEVYNQVEGGLTYDEMYGADGTISAFVGGTYPTDTAGTMPAGGKYDVITDVAARYNFNTTGSMRLKDVVDVFVLGHKLEEVTTQVDANNVLKTFKKGNTSKYIGSADGTSSKRINLAYQQHLSLLRMFNYMNFTLNRDVTMYTGYTLSTVDEAFTGSLNAGSFVINVRMANNLLTVDEVKYAVLFGNQTTPYTWLVIDQA